MKSFEVAKELSINSNHSCLTFNFTTLRFINTSCDYSRRYDALLKGDKSAIGVIRPLLRLDFSRFAGYPEI